MDPKEAKKKFSHPFEPYDIQVDFMSAVYNCIEEGKIGIFDSPTGRWYPYSFLLVGDTFLLVGDTFRYFCGD